MSGDRNMYRTVRKFKSSPCHCNPNLSAVQYWQSEVRVPNIKIFHTSLQEPINKRNDAIVWSNHTSKEDQLNKGLGQSLHLDFRRKKKTTKKKESTYPILATLQHLPHSCNPTPYTASITYQLWPKGKEVVSFRPFVSLAFNETESK